MAGWKRPAGYLQRDGTNGWAAYHAVWCYERPLSWGRTYRRGTRQLWSIRYLGTHPTMTAAREEVSYTDWVEAGCLEEMGQAMA